MSDIFEIELAYDATCKERGVDKHPMIQEMFTVDEEENLIEKKSETKLYLAGNNYLVSDKRLSDDDIAVFCEALSANTYIAELDLRYNNLTDVGVKHIAEILSNNTCLTSLNIMCNNFGEEGAKHLAEALESNTTLKTLRLNGNKINNKGGLYFAQALQVNVALESLDLADTDLKTECLIALSTVLNYNRSLKVLNVSRPILFSAQEETTNHFAMTLKTNETLQELHLDKHGIQDFGVTRLSENLQHNFTLTNLSLSCNRITSDGACKLAQLLKCDTALQVLDLSFNRIGDDGATAIATALAVNNTHLTTLSIVSNEISGRGMCDIADSLCRKNQSVIQLFIWGNRLQESCCIALKNLLDIGRLKETDVDYRPFQVGGTVQLAEVTNGICTYYYRAPAHGDNAQPELTRFTQRVRQHNSDL